MAKIKSFCQSKGHQQAGFMSLGALLLQDGPVLTIQAYHRGQEDRGQTFHVAQVVTGIVTVVSSTIFKSSGVLEFKLYSVVSMTMVIGCIQTLHFDSENH